MVNPVIMDQGRRLYRADPSTGGGGKASFVNFAGAAVSLALIVGLGVWGYKLVMRDVSGVPVVRALEGPMRVAPESPGGTIANHQGLAVNAVQAEGVAEAPADRLVLAPEVALLDEEDAPRPRMRPPAETGATLAGPETLAAGEDVAEQASLMQEEEPLDPVAAAMALADQIAAGATPMVPFEDSTEEEEEVGGDALAAAPLDTEPQVVVPKSGVALSPRPTPRPANRRTSEPEAEIVLASAGVSDTTRATAAALAEAMTGTVAVGTRLVQLGAFDTQADALAVWDRLSRAETFRPLMADKEPVVQEAEKGGRTFYRLRAQGFADLSDARRFCAALLAENADCIPVVAR